MSCKRVKSLVNMMEPRIIFVEDALGEIGARRDPRLVYLRRFRG
jgi:hypothetical protein